MRVNREWLKAHVTTSFEREDEEMDYTRHFGPEDIVWVHAQLQRDNIWAWFSAHVVVEYGGLVSHQRLRACSYESEEDFRQSTFLEMVNKGVEEIAIALEAFSLVH